jgi:GNAT superfamily N-acetyltransferase
MTVLQELRLQELPGKRVTLERAEISDFADVRWLFDTYSSGVYGFVPDSRIKRHLKEGAVHVVKIDGELAAAAIGKPGETLWNIMVVPEYRHLHLGTYLVSAVTPERIRVKCRPHQGMSEKDRERFTDPTPFYERLGYVFESWDYPKSFYVGKDPLTGKGILKSKGEVRSVKIMRKLRPGEKAPEPDLTTRPKVQTLGPAAAGQKPRVKSF